jgi:O-acetyl-ADP-ribose deacetylase
VYTRLGPEASSELLANCYRNSLDLAEGFRSISFPAISTGVYGYPIVDATAVAVRTIREWLAEHPQTSLETITLIAFGAADYRVISEALD